MQPIFLERRTLFKAFQQHLHRNLGSEAAGVCFTGGQAAVLPELVAAVATAAKAEVLASFLAALNTSAHIREQPLELLCPGGLLQ